MSYRAKVVKVMIASPSDVAPEREAIRNVMQEWNFAHSEDKNIVLMPIGWESHSTPSMGGRPQAIINKQVLAGCDLLIAVFWTKLGTPTGKAASGTVEEIEEHVKAKKPAMIYFSTVPVQLDTVDEQQHKALLEFKKEMGKKGLYEQFDSPEDFREKLTRQLAQTVNRCFASKKNGNGHNGEDLLIVRPRLPKVSEPASQLLVAATEDKGGVVYRFRSKHRVTIETNDRDFIDIQIPGIQAHWESALKELQNLGLVEDRRHDGAVFAVTHEGYRVADLLRERHYVG
jgi:hypothetical protein